MIFIKAHFLFLESLYACSYIYTVRNYGKQNTVAILQIVRGGKVLRMDKLVPIRWKTFTVCQFH